MAIKTFTTGEVLTASDTNTYLANSGLVYVAGGALSSTATNFAGCFTSTYANYRIVIGGFGSSVVQYLVFQMLTGTTPETGANYYTAMTGYTSSGAASSIPLAAGSSGYLGYNYQANSALRDSSCSFDIMGPALAQRTQLVGTSQGFASATTIYNAWSGSTNHNLANAYDGIRILNLGGGTIAGDVRIYGYRQA
jgi:hypothetical protein